MSERVPVTAGRSPGPRTPAAAPSRPAGAPAPPGINAARAARAQQARADRPAAPRPEPPRPAADPMRSAGTSWGRGQELPGAARARFSAAFGADLSDVELHPEAAAVRSLGARAATSGRHIGFAPGAYRPGTPGGDRLLAHELAHVIQQDGSSPAVPSGVQLSAGGHGDRHEAEAETAARLAVAGHRVPRLSAARRGPPQHDDGPTVFVGPVQRTRLAEDYPGLEASLGDEQWDVLEAAYRRRMDVVAPVVFGPPAPPTPGEDEPATSVEVPLSQVASDRLTFVDVDIWPTVHGVLQAGGSDALVGELLRNEMVRRFVAGLPITLRSRVTIRLADPLGALGGPNHLEYSIDGTSVGQTDGLIDPANLDSTYGPALDDVVQGVAQQAYKVALGTALLGEVTALGTAVAGVRSRMDRDAGDVALNEIRGLSQRIAADRGYLREMSEISGWAPPGSEDVGSQIDPLAETVATMLEEMQAYREANDPGRALGESNESAGTWLAGKAEKNWDEGGVGGTVVGGLAYAGAFAVAFVDAGESVLSFGLHETAIDVSKAWQRGDISYNELQDIFWGAAFRAILIAAVTRGLGAATSRVGAGVATRFGLGELSLARATVTGTVSGGITGPASLAAHDLFTRGWAASHPEGSAARAIIERGIPTPGQYLFATGSSMALGGLGAHSRMARLHRSMEGQITVTPSGPMRVLRVEPSGTQVLGPVEGATSRATAGSRASVIDLEPVVGPDGSVTYQPAGTVDSPVGPMRLLASGSDGTQLVVPPSGGLGGARIVVVPRGWRPSAGDAAHLLPEGTTGAGPGVPRPAVPALPGPRVGVPLLPAPSGGAMLPVGPPPVRPATGRQAVTGYLQQLAAGRAGSASDLFRSYRATQPRPAVDWSLLLTDPFGLRSLAPLDPLRPLTAPQAAGPGWTSSGYELFPGLTGTPAATPGSAPLVTVDPSTGLGPVLPSTGGGPAAPQIAWPMLPATGQTSTSQVLAQLPAVEVVTPDTLVWVNTRTGVYHVQGSSRFRRGTLEGQLSTVAEAEAAGYRQAGAARSAGPNVTAEGHAARGEPRYVMTGRVSSTKGARGAQSIVPAAGEYPSSAGVANTHRMHPLARDLGFTPTGGYRLGPDYINTVWDRRIEKYVKALDRGTRASDEIWVTGETYTVPGTSRLHSKTYKVWSQDARSGRRTPLFELTFEVDWAAWTANPSAQPRPRITVDYVNEAQIGNLSGFSGSD